MQQVPEQETVSSRGRVEQFGYRMAVPTRLASADQAPPVQARQEGAAQPPTAVTMAVTADGPGYGPQDRLRATREWNYFELSWGAEFQHNPGLGINAGDGEVRQLIRWDQAFEVSHQGPPHAGFAGLQANVWHADRDVAGNVYGDRNAPGTHLEDAYYAAPACRQADMDQANGRYYRGHDLPAVESRYHGRWDFMLEALDVSNNPAMVVGQSGIKAFVF
ncbi:hypothetical protein [Kineosporia sp. NBRC 101731]|uniref:hypothetical protein n=1 Tax=Kineosporia sp. NBRC 101731 TaxID=3032199 RepID=UPI0025570CC6|nr:hypothetical protein [Kineosporia sp. NBRC 101731]